MNQGFFLSFGLRVFKVVIFLVLVVVRAIMERLPREDCRKLEDMEKNLSVIADDGEKVLLPGQVTFMSMLGWLIIFSLGVKPILAIVKLIMGWE